MARPFTGSSAIQTSNSDLCATSGSKQPSCGAVHRSDADRCKRYPEARPRRRGCAPYAAGFPQIIRQDQEQGECDGEAAHTDGAMLFDGGERRRSAYGAEHQNQKCRDKRI
jgi:hypothetical protein